MKIGYARVSTKDQSFDLQLDALQKVGCEKIYREVVSGARAERPVLKQLLGTLRKGDVLVIWKLDRLGRSLKHLVGLVNDLRDQKIGLQSLNDPIDTTTAQGRLSFNLFAALAEFERNLIRERTQAGLQAARTRGKNGGRPKALGKDKRALVVELYNGKKTSLKKICDMMDISKPTLYAYGRESEQQNTPAG